MNLSGYGKSQCPIEGTNIRGSKTGHVSGMVQIGGEGLCSFDDEFLRLQEMSLVLERMETEELSTASLVCAEEREPSTLESGISS